MDSMQTKLISYTCGLSLLFLAMQSTAEAPINTSSATKGISSEQNTSDEYSNSEINIESLATATIVDTEDEFQAVIFDQQSQVTIGHLYWSERSAEGTIVFDYHEAKDQVSLQIPNIQALEPTERYSVLLRGLHEAGIAWLNQSNTDSTKPTMDIPEVNSDLTFRPMGSQPSGFFDGVKPQSISILSEVTRYAHGWAYDPDRDGEREWIHVYASSNSRYAEKLIGAVLTNVNRPDVNRIFEITGTHGFRFKIPEEWDLDGDLDVYSSAACEQILYPYAAYVCRTYLYAFAIDKTQDGNKLLSGSPRIIETRIPYYQ
jgi:hypothetical protein